MRITTNIREHIKGEDFERLIVAGESADIIAKALDKLIAFYCDRIDKKHEKALRKAREGWIELPKDKNGAALDPKDQPLMTPGGLSISWSVEYDNEEWFLYAQISTNGIKSAIEWEERRFKPSECELVKAPYDKTGRTIEVGMWVKCKYSDQIERVDDIIVGDDSIVISLSKTGLWCYTIPENWEITREPDTQEKIDADALLNPREYFEKYPSMPKEERLRAQKLDLLRRQRVLDGVES